MRQYKQRNEKREKNNYRYHKRTAEKAKGKTPLFFTRLKIFLSEAVFRQYAQSRDFFDNLTAMLTAERSFFSKKSEQNP